jgi:hypothetical protein
VAEILALAEELERRAHERPARDSPGSKDIQGAEG